MVVIEKGQNQKNSTIGQCQKWEKVKSRKIGKGRKQRRRKMGKSLKQKKV